MTKLNIDWDAIQWSEWDDVWERTFMFIPKADIHGKTIYFGFAWKRSRFGTVIGEYNEKENMTPIYSILDTAYARRKDVFIQKLKDTMQ